MKLFLTASIIFLCSLASFGQNILELKVENYKTGMSFKDFLIDFERIHNCRFYFIDQWFEKTEILSDINGLPLQLALNNIFDGTDIRFVSFYDYGLIFVKDPTKSIAKEAFIESIKSRQKKTLAASIGTKGKTTEGELVTLSGQIKDAKTGDPVENASVFAGLENVSTTTNASGQFSIKVPVGTQIIIFRHAAYEENILEIEIYESGSLNVELSEAPRLLDEVEISGQKLNPVESKIGEVQIRMADIKKMPSMLGEADLFKQIQILPGVTSVGELSTGFNVRGGGADQNLILYDGMQVFNNSHVFGFFSAFNSDVIDRASFYKSGVPAEYGGRVSSVLSIDSKSGDFKRWNVSGGAGIVASNISITGPIVKDKTSAVISARSSYSDWLIKNISYQNINKSSVSFYDLSAKIVHKFNEQNKLSLSAYTSKDHFGLPSDTTFEWQNNLVSLKYDVTFSARSYGSFMAGFGQYAYKVSNRNPNFAYAMDYNISYPTLKADYNYQIGKHKFRTGIGSTYYTISPGTIKPTSSSSNVVALSIPNNHSLENAWFINDDIDFSEKIHVDLGVRIPVFLSLGGADVYLYQQGVPKSNDTIIDTLHYSSGSTIKTFSGIEPRISLRYTINPLSSIKVGYNRIYQYLHLISNSVAITPIDIWQPSNYYFNPQQGDQYSIGYFKQTKEKKFDFSVEGFWKEINNILDFKDGSNIVLNPNLETSLLNGIGQSYGIELSINKPSGRLTGGINYSYIRSLRKVTSPFTNESINSGKFYPSNYDQPNVFNLNWKYSLSRRFALTGNFTYRTGRPITIPTSYTIVDNVPIVNYSDRNEYRLPDYHRLDLAFVIEGSHKRKKLWDGTWTISFYNVYARKNAYSVFYQKNENGLVQPYQISIIGTILPSISYHFKF